MTKEFDRIDMVTSAVAQHICKLFELMLAHHTEIVTSRVIKEAEESGDVLQSVGVAFALENEDENQQYH